MLPVPIARRMSVVVVVVVLACWPAHDVGASALSALVPPARPEAPVILAFRSAPLHEAPAPAPAPETVIEAPPPSLPTAPPPAAAVAPPAVPPAPEPAAASPVLTSDVLHENEPPRPRRPRFSVALGMGISRDTTGHTDGGTDTVPAFEAQVGIGEELLGFEGRMFSSQAAGRSAAGIDRLALDAMLALRPLGSRHPRAVGWAKRVARLVTINFGVTGEHVSAGQQSVWRPGFVLGSHVDLPLSVVPESSEVRLRIGARKMWGGQVTAGATPIDDTRFELFAGLAVGF